MQVFNKTRMYKEGSVKYKIFTTEIVFEAFKKKFTNKKIVCKKVDIK